jgi:hypothetical protein
MIYSSLEKFTHILDHLFRQINFVDPAFKCLHFVEVGCVANVSEELSLLPHGASNEKQDQHKQ